MTGDPDIELGAFGSPAADHGAHLCDHRAADFGAQGCPNWPACLTPGIGLLRTTGPVTDDEAVAFAARWREAMAQGRIGPPRVLHIDPAYARRNPSILARIARALRGGR